MHLIIITDTYCKVIYFASAAKTEYSSSPVRARAAAALSKGSFFVRVTGLIVSALKRFLPRGRDGPWSGTRSVAGGRGSLKSSFHGPYQALSTLF